MMQKLKQLLVASATLCMLATPALLPATAAAAGYNPKHDLCSGSELDLSGGTNCKGGSSGSFNSLLHTVVNIFSTIVGVIAVIMIIVGGLKYITSGGDSQKVASAKNTLLFAIVGLIIVALAQIIVRFVLSKTP